MAHEGELILHGYRQFLAACDGAEKEAKREVRSILREAGDTVRREATRKFMAYNSQSAHGYRVVVRRRGIAVEQSIRKTTGDHPEYGSLQMRKGLLPALQEKREAFEHAMEHALDLAADVFEYKSY